MESDRVLFETILDTVPPPKANRYMTSRNGKRFLPKKIKQQIDYITAMLSLFYKGETIEYPVEIEVLFHLPTKRKIDLDNMMKTLGDCLQEAGILKDDSLIHRKVVEKVLSDSAKTEIKIKKYNRQKTTLKRRGKDVCKV